MRTIHILVALTMILFSTAQPGFASCLDSYSKGVEFSAKGVRQDLTWGVGGAGGMGAILGLQTGLDPFMYGAAAAGVIGYTAGGFLLLAAPFALFGYLVHNELVDHRSVFTLLIEAKLGEGPTLRRAFEAVRKDRPELTLAHFMSMILEADRKDLYCPTTEYRLYSFASVEHDALLKATVEHDLAAAPVSDKIARSAH